MIPSLLDTNNTPADQRELTIQEAELVMKCLGIDRDSPGPLDIPVLLDRAGHSPGTAWYDRVKFPMELLALRLGAFSGKQITAGLALLVVDLADSNPGKLVSYAYALARSEYKTLITVEHFSRMFPHGVPTEQAIRKYWELQKDGSRNRLDDHQEWS